jgi:flagellar basal-body rod protein FlgG
MMALWTAATGMQAQQTCLDVTSNNLANLSTTGFKSSRPEFQDLMYQVQKKAGTETSTSNGSLLPVGIEIGMGSKLTCIQKIFTQGDYVQTGNQFDWAIEGDGFFQVDNNGTTMYTRAGNFNVNSSGVLCTANGLRVIPEIDIPTTAVAFTIDSGGTWSVTDSKGNIVSTARIQLARFVNNAGLTSEGGNLYGVTQGSGPATLDYPGNPGYGTISQNYLEMSNVNAITEMVNMIEILQAYELNSKSVQTADQMLQVVNQLKSS